jgi:hypothetical protein
MNDILSVVFSPRFFLSAGVFISLSLLISWAGLWLQHRLQDHPFNDWLVEHIGIPLLNALAMILFIAILYPVLFPLESLPDFYTLLSSEAGRINQLINWIFVLSLMIPMIPVLGPRIEIVLPIQGLVVLALIANWLGTHLGAQAISMLPSAIDVMWMLVWGVIAARLAVHLSTQLGEQIDYRYHMADAGTFLYPIFALIFQTPTLAIYARGILPS